MSASVSLNFERAVLRFDLGHPTVSRVARCMCRVYTVWPSLLFDADARDQHTVMARHVCWRLAYLLTDLDYESIAHLTGSHPQTVARWARGWQLLAARHDDCLDDGDTFWQRHVELVLGPACDALGLPLRDWPHPLDRRAREPEDAPTTKETGSSVA